MTADRVPEAELTPITPERLAREVASLSAQRRDGALKAEVYDQKFARMIGELRERRIDGSREEVLAALRPLEQQGLVTSAELERLLKKLGI